LRLRFFFQRLTSRIQLSRPLFRGLLLLRLLSEWASALSGSTESTVWNASSREVNLLFMRHKDQVKTLEKPAQMPGSESKDERQNPEENSPARLRIKVGPPEVSWSHAKWLALADQALLE
jgi:hypothetical protein